MERSWYRWILKDKDEEKARAFALAEKRKYIMKSIAACLTITIIFECDENVNGQLRKDESS